MQVVTSDHLCALSRASVSDTCSLTLAMLSEHLTQTGQLRLSFTAKCNLILSLVFFDLFGTKLVKLCLVKILDNKSQNKSSHTRGNL